MENRSKMLLAQLGIDLNTQCLAVRKCPSPGCMNACLHGPVGSEQSMFFDTVPLYLLGEHGPRECNRWKIIFDRGIRLLRMPMWKTFRVNKCKDYSKSS